MSILLFVIILSVLVYIHEFGHFRAARRLGIAVEEFGFGFPPRMFGKRVGQTIYSINWIPFGGFVRLKGEGGEQAADPDSFAYASISRRALVLGAGVLMNFLLAMALFIFGFAAGAPTALPETLPAQATVRDARVYVAEIPSDSPAIAYDIQKGDILRQIESVPIGRVSDLTSFTRAHTGERINLTIERDGVQKSIPVTVTVKNGEPQIGLVLVETGIISFPIHIAFVQGAEQTLSFTWQIIASFGNLIRDLVVNRTVSPDIAGPIGIAALTGQVAELGFLHVIQFIAVLSLSLAVLNVFPIPALDGGRLFFLIIEKFRGRAVSRRVEGLVHGVGFYVLLLLIVLISVRDVSRFGIGEAISSFFSRIF